MFMRGQVTIFVIIGLIIIIGVSFFFYLQQIIFDVPEHTQNPGDEVRLYVEQCISNELDEAVYIVARQGGYLYPEYFKFEPPYRTSYLFFNNENLMPSINESENALADYIDKNIENCVDFSVFEELNITVDEPSSSTIISNDTITGKTRWDIEIKTPLGNVEKLHNFEVELYSYFGFLHSIAREATRKMEINQQFIDYRAFERENIFYNITKTLPNEIRYEVIYSEEPKLEFIFYEQIDVSQWFDEQSPRFTKAEDIEAEVGEFIDYSFEAYHPEGSSLKFYSESLLFEVMPDGSLFFVVEEHMVGTHTVPVYVKDEYGNYDFRIVEVEVKNE